jgi:D-glycero-alpha-D-manno-heptose-7-phosphate kinase
LDRGTVKRFSANLHLFFTGVQRDAGEILAEQSRGSETTVRQLDEIRAIGGEIRGALEAGRIDDVGPLMDRHWRVKRRISRRISADWIDETYAEALRAGATGGKIVGAGGGGFLLFYCPGDPSALREAMARRGFRPMDFEFDTTGTKIIFNSE